MSRLKNWLLPLRMTHTFADASEPIDGIFPPIRLVPVVVIAAMFAAVVFAVWVLRPAPKPAPPPGVFMLDVKDNSVKRLTLPADSLFSFNKSELKAGAADRIKDFASDAKALGKAQIMILGYTDPLGMPERNTKLSLDRADAVRQVLVKAGLDDKLITIAGRGASELVKKRDDCPGGDQEAKVRDCLEPDRRVEIWMRDLAPSAAASAASGAS